MQQKCKKNINLLKKQIILYFIEIISKIHLQNKKIINKYISMIKN